MTKTIKIALASFLITAGLIKGVPAFAEPAASAINVSVVRTADLDLSTKAGEHALDQRLVTAAREVCGSASDVDLEGKNDVRQCRADVLGHARGTSGQLANRGNAPIQIAVAQ
jgi:UrcA family protein